MIFIGHVIGSSMYYFIFALFVFIVDASPRYSSNYIKEPADGKIGRLEYSVKGPPKIALIDRKSLKFQTKIVYFFSLK